jgi:geranylgeranyl diphosphate synthase type I
MHDDEQFFLTTYKDAAFTIRDHVRKYAGDTLKTFEELDPVRVETIRFVVEGGKRFRPALSYLIGKFYGIDAVTPCLALEYFHKFILSHDDIIDRDRMRYNAPTVHAKLEEMFDTVTMHASSSREFSLDKSIDGARWHFGNSMGIVAADLMCADAYKVILDSDISDERKIHLCRLMTVATEEVVYGWYIQFLMDYMKLGDARLSLERIIESLFWVTGSYTIKFPLEFGFALVGVDTPHGIEKFALDLGVLFQTGDDIIGIFGDSEVTGKSNSGDISQGKKTVPLWFAYTMARDADKDVLERLVGKLDLSDEEAEDVRDIVKRSGGYDKTREFMREYRDRCLAQLETIEIPHDLKRFLRGFTIYLEKREM